MSVYVISGNQVKSLHTEPAKLQKNVVSSIEEFSKAELSVVRLAAIWNALPGVAATIKFRDRKTAVRRLWSAFERLPLDPELAGSTQSRAGSKQARVIGLLQRPEGATLDEVATAMDWQRNTVRGLISGALKKKLGLAVISEQSERGRLYRIPAGQSAAR